MVGSSVIQKNVPLAPLTSWLVGGPAEFFAEPKTVEELKAVLESAHAQKLPITVLGGGTNVLISDAGIKGLTICLRKLAGTETEITGDRLKITAMSGSGKTELLKIFLKHKLAPALFLAGLPGDIGGGIVMNAGVGEMITPREFVELTDWVEVIRLNPPFEIVRFNKDELKWSYRHCKGWEPGIVIRVGLSWPNSPDPDVLTKVRAANLVRAQKQPLDQPSCGSVFINPEGHKSGQLIEQSGLKGFAIGGAKVSEKHANFIVNFNRATAADIDAVIKHVQKTVRAKTGVSLKTEVVYLA